METPFIPKDAEWYIADLVEEIRVAGDARIIIQINTHLIHAQSPMEAHRRAMKLGRSHNSAYKNPDNKRVSKKFLGLQQLMVVYETLEDGCELFYEERITRNADAGKKRVRERSRLAVFDKLSDEKKPNYMPGSIWKQMVKAGVVDPPVQKIVQESKVRKVGRKGKAQK